MSKKPNSKQLHLITNCQDWPNDKYLQFIETIATAGISDIQLRQKNWSSQDLLAFGRELSAILKPTPVNLIVNDSLELAVKLDADGIHLGQQDISPDLARKTLGSNKKIGLSIETLPQLHIANSLSSINYVAASAIFPSKSKNNIRHLWGIDGLQQFCTLSHHPVIAIGGINHENLASITATNITGVAIISAIHEATNPTQYIAQLTAILTGEHHV